MIQTVTMAGVQVEISNTPSGALQFVVDPVSLQSVGVSLGKEVMDYVAGKLQSKALASIPDDRLHTMVLALSNEAANRGMFPVIGSAPINPEMLGDGYDRS